MNAFVAALQFLTFFPWPKRTDPSANEPGGAAVFFPVIGFLLGLILTVANVFLSPFASPALTSAILMTMLTLLTRGFHLDALGDTFDGLGAGGDRQRMLQVMDDSHTGAFGAIAIVLALFLKIHALESMDAERWRALLAAPVLGRWSMVLMGYRSTAAKTGLGSIFVEHLSTQHVLSATLITLLLAIAILRATGLVILISVALFTVASRNYFHRRLGGVTGDTCGAVGELCEASVMIWLALGAR